MNYTLKRQINYLIGFLLLSTGLFAISSCSNSGAIKADQQRNLYDWEAKLIHPELMVYHQSTDSSTFYFKLFSDELLYTRSGPEDPFSARMKFFLEVKDLKTGSIDSLEFNYYDINPEQESRQIIGKHRFKLKDLTYYDLRIKITDLSRKTSVIERLRVEKSPGLIRENMLIIDDETLAPVFGNYSGVGRSLLMSSDRYKAEKLSISESKSDLPLPPPPYSYSEPKLDLGLEQEEELSSIGDLYLLSLDSSINVIRSADGLSSFALFGRPQPYPEVRELDQLIQSMRYITSRSEFKKITSSSYPKKALDEFWIETAGTKEKARSLIRTYYRRVREANIYFSGITEGWKSDRGLVHIVFGNPNKIIVESDKEIWVYGEDSNISALTFTFRKKTHPYSHNLYVLDRSALYKPGWDQAVANWRRGRVFSE